jgi:alpha-N-arabinofuranosidase
MLNTLIRVADFVPIANMTGAVEFGRLWEKRGITYGVPSYWAFRMYSNADVANLLATKVEVAQYSIKEGSPRTPDIPDVPYLDLVAVANRAGDKITLFGVNRNLTADISSTIALSGFTVHSASGKLLAAQDIYAGNDDDRPEAVVPADFKLAASGSTFSHMFPKASVTVIELR